MDVDILVSGHTHKFEAYEYEGRFFVNPGSATGAISPCFKEHQENEEADVYTKENGLVGAENTPSFVLMDVQSSSVILYVYQLIDGEVKVEKLEYSKKIFG